MSKLRTLILAAGKGTRMKSKTAKVLHPVGGLPMLEFVLRSARELSDDVRVVVGHQSDAVRDVFDGVTFIHQEKQLGTGHAVMAARDALADAEGNLLVLPGDVPMMSAETLGRFAAFHNDGGFAASVLTARLDNPSGYGRVVRRSDHEVGRRCHAHPRQGGSADGHVGGHGQRRRSPEARSQSGAPDARTQQTRPG